MVNANRDFLKKANTVILRSPVSYMKITLHPSECADGMWLFRNDKDAPFVLAVDCKSRQIGKPTRDRLVASEGALDDLPGQGSQAVHFLNVATAAAAWPADEVQDGSMLDALRCGNFLYLYLSTQTESTFAVGSNILHLGRADSECFLSFFKTYYTLHRSEESGSLRMSATSKP